MKEFDEDLDKALFGERESSNSSSRNPRNKNMSFREVQRKYLKGSPLLRVTTESQAHYAWSVLWSPQYLKGVTWKRARKEYSRLKKALTALGYDLEGTQSELHEKWRGVN